MAGKAGQADNIAGNINKLIARSRSIALSGASNRDKQQLWGLLRQTWNWDDKKQPTPIVDPNLINDHFAGIASDPSYEAVLKASLQGMRKANKPSNDQNTADVGYLS